MDTLYKIQQYVTLLFFTNQLLCLNFLVRMYRKGNKQDAMPGIQVKDK